MDEAVLVTDGSADNSTGSGGWAAIIRTPIFLIELTGWATQTTSNRMEMQAAIEGLRELKTPTNVELVSDSAYLLNAIKGQWYVRWITDHENSILSGEPTSRPNIDLWKELSGLLAFHSVTCIKIKGHSGDYWNTRADKLAQAARISKTEFRNVTPNFY